MLREAGGLENPYGYYGRNPCTPPGLNLQSHRPNSCSGLGRRSPSWTTLIAVLAGHACDESDTLGHAKPCSESIGGGFMGGLTPTAEQAAADRSFLAAPVDQVKPSPWRGKTDLPAPGLFLEAPRPR